MSSRHAPAKEIIFREGDAGDYAYILTSGRVEILKHADHGDVSLAILEAGAVFGEMALFEPGALRSASARTLDASELQMLTMEEFQGLFQQCPPQLVPFLKSLMMRLRDLNARIAAKERATVRLDAEINSVTIAACGPQLAESFAPVSVHVANFPFSIGGYLMGDAPGDQRLNLPCQESPLLISPHHCNLERHGDEVYVVDQGSRFGTIVNGQAIGRGKPTFKALIVPGENLVQLGGPSSAYKLQITAS
ncbi:MAG: cyclic nucleotide-binding domain-containing protein [Rickettsiales bacterium]|nr:cyclic nucleotide-binding domain-containing protein [Rickettsiales bacterium]